MSESVCLFLSLSLYFAAEGAFFVSTVVPVLCTTSSLPSSSPLDLPNSLVPASFSASARNRTANYRTRVPRPRCSSSPRILATILPSSRRTLPVFFQLVVYDDSFRVRLIRFGDVDDVLRGVDGFEDVVWALDVSARGWVFSGHRVAQTFLTTPLLLLFPIDR